MSYQTREEQLTDILAEDALPPFEPVIDDEPAIENEPEPEKSSRSVLTVTALGGRRVAVVEENFRRLVEVAEVEVRGDLSRVEFGALLSAAKATNRHALIDDLLAVRCGLSPLYRIRNESGRPWFSHPRSVVPAVTITQEVRHQPTLPQEIHP